MQLNRLAYFVRSTQFCNVQADILHKHLLELRLEDVLGKEVLDSMTDPQVRFQGWNEKPLTPKTSQKT